MLDYNGKIEKVDKDGNKSNDIFIPNKTSLTDFINKFKYGSNAAANCGLRIFALKKWCDFLTKEIKDNEYFDDVTDDGVIIGKFKKGMKENAETIAKHLCSNSKFLYFN